MGSHLGGFVSVETLVWAHTREGVSLLHPTLVESDWESSGHTFDRIVFPLSRIQIQAERLKKLQCLAEAEAVAKAKAVAVTEEGNAGVPALATKAAAAVIMAEGLVPASAAAAAGRPLQWYIMTSPFTHRDTLSHFEEHDYFGLLRDQVHFFQQGFLPCLTEEGVWKV